MSAGLQMRAVQDMSWQDVLGSVPRARVLAIEF